MKFCFCLHSLYYYANLEDYYFINFFQSWYLLPVVRATARIGSLHQSVFEFWNVSAFTYCICICVINLPVMPLLVFVLWRCILPTSTNLIKLLTHIFSLVSLLLFFFTDRLLFTSGLLTAFEMSKWISLHRRVIFQH